MLHIKKLVLVFVFTTAAACAEEDLIKSKLDSEKTAYKTASEKIQKTVTAQFDEREKKARADGDKKAVDQIKAERRAFKDNNELPKSAPSTLKSQHYAARSAMESAYLTAIKAYTKAAKDIEAAAAEKDLEEFRKHAGPPPEAPPPTGFEALSRGLKNDANKTLITEMVDESDKMKSAPQFKTLVEGLRLDLQRFRSLSDRMAEGDRTASNDWLAQFNKLEESLGGDDNSAGKYSSLAAKNQRHIEEIKRKLRKLKGNLAARPE